MGKTGSILKLGLTLDWSFLYSLVSEIDQNSMVTVNWDFSEYTFFFFFSGLRGFFTINKPYCLQVFQFWVGLVSCTLSKDQTIVCYCLDHFTWSIFLTDLPRRILFSPANLYFLIKIYVAKKHATKSVRNSIFHSASFKVIAIHSVSIASKCLLLCAF